MSVLHYIQVNVLCVNFWLQAFSSSIFVSAFNIFIVFPYLLFGFMLLLYIHVKLFYKIANGN